MVQILEGLRKLSALRNSEVYAFGSILNIALTVTASSGHISEVATIGGVC